MTKDEVYNVTVSPNQSLMLRCQIKFQRHVYPEWEKGSKVLDSRTLACSSKAEKEVHSYCIDIIENFEKLSNLLYIKLLLMLGHRYIDRLH